MSPLGQALAAFVATQPATKPAEPPAEPTAAQAPTRGPAIEFGVLARYVVQPMARQNAAFGATPGDTEWTVRQGARLGGDARFGPLGIVVQLQDVRAWGQSTNTVSDDPFTGAHQAYVELSGERLGRRERVSAFMRVGRQEIILWSRRLVAASPWQPGMRAFDAARARVDVGRFGIEAAALMLRQPRTFARPDDATLDVRSPGDQLSWVEASAKLHPAFNLHATTFLLSQNATESDPTREQLYAMPGIYMHGEPLAGLKYAVEGYGQFGKNGTKAHRAYAMASTVSYQFDARLQPMARATYELASGSRCTAAPDSAEGCDEDVSSDFEDLAGAQHAWRGFADLAAMSNIRDLALGGSLFPSREVEFRLDYHWLGLHEPGGRWMRTSGATVGRGWDPANTRNTLGHEVDVVVGYEPWEALYVRSGYSAFVPTRAGAELGGTQTVHFVYLWLVAKIGHRFKVR